MDELFTLVRLVGVLAAAAIVLLAWVLFWLWCIVGTLQAQQQSITAIGKILERMNSTEKSALSILAMLEKEKVQP